MSERMSEDCLQSVCEVESNRTHFRRWVVCCMSTLTWHDQTDIKSTWLFWNVMVGITRSKVFLVCVCEGCKFGYQVRWFLAVALLMKGSCASWRRSKYLINLNYKTFKAWNIPIAVYELTPEVAIKQIWPPFVSCWLGEVFEPATSHHYSAWRGCPCSKEGVFPLDSTHTWSAMQDTCRKAMGSIERISIFLLPFSIGF